MGGMNVKNITDQTNMKRKRPIAAPDHSAEVHVFMGFRPTALISNQSH